MLRRSLGGTVRTGCSFLVAAHHADPANISDDRAVMSHVQLEAVGSCSRHGQSGMLESRTQLIQSTRSLGHKTQSRKQVPFPRCPCNCNMWPMQTFGIRITSSSWRMSSFSNLVMTSRGDSVAADDFAMALPSRSCQPFILNQAVVCSRQFSSAGFLGLQSETGWCGLSPS